MALSPNARPAPGRRGRTPRLALVVALLALPLACGDDDDGATDTDVTSASREATESGTGTGTDPDPDSDSDAGTAEIVISGFAFTGADSVPVGTTVTVRNDDTTEHTWTATDGAFSSGTLAGGDTFSFTFDEPGEFTYSCAFHPSMTGTITVTG